MWRSTVSSVRCRWWAMCSTSPSRRTSATSACCAAGWTSSGRRHCSPDVAKRNPRSLAAESAPDCAALHPGYGVRRIKMAGHKARPLKSSRLEERLRRDLLPLEREVRAVVERADASLVEALFVNLEIGAVQRIRRQLFDREADGLGRVVEAAIGEAGTLLVADRGGEQLSAAIVIECGHVWTPSNPVLCRIGVNAHNAIGGETSR